MLAYLQQNSLQLQQPTKATESVFERKCGQYCLTTFTNVNSANDDAYAVGSQICIQNEH